MALEIERKFLVESERYKALGNASEILQVYLKTSKKMILHYHSK